MLSTLSGKPRIGNLRQQVKERLRAGIISGEIEAAQLYTVATFTERLGVSATPIREALFDLANEGLVEVFRNRGFRVVALTQHDLDEIFELRLLLEVPSMARLAGRIGTDEMQALYARAEQIETYAIAGDVAQFLETDRRFHLRLLGLLENRRLCEIVGRLRDQSRLYGIPKLVGSADFITSAKEHRAILDSLKDDRADVVQALMTRHLKHTRGIWAGLREGG